MTCTLRWRVLLALAVIGVPATVQGQVRSDSLRITVRPDTARAAHPSAVIKNDSLAKPASHSPLLAMGLSALLPGGGQLYNGSYWKVPVILGLGGYFVYEILDNHRQYKVFRDRYQEGLAALPGGDPYVLRLREFYKDQRDEFGWYFLILYVVNIADAYVDASLFSFDVGDNLGYRGGMVGPAVTVRLWLP